MGIRRFWITSIFIDLFTGGFSWQTLFALFNPYINQGEGRGREVTDLKSSSDNHNLDRAKH